jgi:DNA-binding response OmpR family regulator
MSSPPTSSVAASPRPSEGVATTAPEALEAAWERIQNRVDDHLSSAEFGVAQLLEGPLDPEETPAFLEQINELADWIGDIGMVPAARLARLLRRHLDDPTFLEAANLSGAVTAAGLIDDLRSSLDTARAEGTLTLLGNDLLIVGPVGRRVDGLIWLAALTGFTIDHAEHLDSWPEDLDAVVVVDESNRPLDSTLLICRSASERLAHVPLVVVTDRSTPAERARLAEFAATLLPAGARPGEVLHEVRRHLHVAQRRDEIAVRGEGAAEVANSINRRGLAAWSDEDDAVLLAGLEGARASGVLLLPSHDNGLFIQLLRAQPATKRLTIVEVLESEDMAAAHPGVDATIEEPGAISRRVPQLRELLKQRAETDVELTSTSRSGGVPWSSAVFLAERLLLGAHRSSSVASVCVVMYGEDEQIDAIDGLQEGLSREFRTDDIVTRSGERENILVLAGVDRNVTRSRLVRIVEQMGLSSVRVGIAEFPYDAQSVGELVRSARAVIERSGPDGPTVMSVDWHPDRQNGAEALVADSDPATSRVIVQSLERLGLTVQDIPDGQLLLERLRDPEFEPPKLLILDFDMPSVDGLTVLRRLHRQEALRRFEVVMLASRTRESDIRLAYDLGVTDVIQKPFSPGILARRLKRLLQEAQ